MNKIIKLMILLTVNGLVFGAELSLRESAYVNANMVSLRDLATIRADDPVFIQKLESLVIGASPSNGLIRYYTKYDILRSLRQNKINTENLKFSGAPRTMVALDEGSEKSNPENSVVISLKNKFTVTNDLHVCLRDIAEIKAETDETFRKIGDITLDKIPLPGMTMVIGSNDIIKLIRKNKISVQNVSFVNNSSVSLYLPALIISRGDILKAARQFILQHFGWSEGDVMIELKNQMQDIALPEGPVDYQFSITGSGKCLGAISVELNLVQNGKIMKFVTLGFSIRNFSTICTALREIKKGEVINEDDLTVERRDVTLHPEWVLVSREDIIGKTALRNMDRGTPVTAKFVENPVIIRKNQLVRIELKNEIMNISTTGKALENGRSGEAIKIKNIDTDKIVTGCVIDSETVGVRV